MMNTTKPATPVNLPAAQSYIKRTPSDASTQPEIRKIRTFGNFGDIFSNAVAINASVTPSKIRIAIKMPPTTIVTIP